MSKQSNVTISQTENHTERLFIELGALFIELGALYAEFCFHYIGQFSQLCKNLSDTMEIWYER